MRLNFRVFFFIYVQSYSQNQYTIILKNGTDHSIFVEGRFLKTNDYGPFYKNTIARHWVVIIFDI